MRSANQLRRCSLTKNSRTYKRIERVKLPPINRFLQVKEYSQRESRFKLGCLVGVGSCSQVHQAMDIYTGELVACKSIPLKYMNKEKIESEIKVLRLLNHQNIVKYVFHEINKDTLCLYQQFISMGSLLSLISQFGSLNENVVRQYCSQILDGLAYLHSKRIMHLDLKSSNILLDSEGNVKISDFGCSKQLEQSMFTQSVLMGSVPWMAPEVIRQEQLSSSADVWSFGCIVVEMLTAKLPWSDQISFDNPATAMIQICMSNECPIIPNNISEQLKDFVSLCLQLDPQQRATIKQLKQHIFLQQ